jgi:hypothetical protein
MKSSQKRDWVTPQLIVHGDVETITQDIIVKTPGFRDVIVIGQDVIQVPGSKVIR